MKVNATLVVVVRTSDCTKPSMTCYECTRVYSDDAKIKVAWTMRKPDQTAGYTVSYGEYGARCECQAWEFSHSPKSCKHVVALESVGLLPKRQ